MSINNPDVFLSENRPESIFKLMDYVMQSRRAMLCLLVSLVTILTTSLFTKLLFFLTILSIDDFFKRDFFIRTDPIAYFTSDRTRDLNVN